MAFQVYPNPQLQPLSLAAGVSSTQPMGAFASSGAKFIRIAVGGLINAHPPQFFLTAGTGAEVQAILNLYVSPFPTPNMVGVEEAADVILTNVASGIYLLTFTLYIATSWVLRIVNADPVNPQTFVWVVGDSDAESQQPWINVTRTLPGYSVKVFAGQAENISLSVANYGTGTANLVAGTTPGPGFAVTTVPPPIPPFGTDIIVITYTGAAAPGQVGPTYTVTASPADTTASGPFPVPPGFLHNDQVTLAATTRLIEAVFLVDASGSMAYTPDGQITAIPDETRWAKLTAGTSQCWTLLNGFASNNGKFALAAFPDITTGAIPAPSPSSKVLLPSSAISMTSQTAAQTALAAHTPVPNGGATPLGFGLGTVMGVGLPVNPASLFETTPDAVAFNERFLILQSDGFNNSNPPDPSIFLSPDKTFINQNVSVIAVGYGKQGTPFEVDDDLLMNLAVNSGPLLPSGLPSGGIFLDAFADDSGLALKKAFRQAIGAGLDLDPTVDPTGILTSAQPESRYDITVLPYDRKVGFTVDWVTRDAPISVSLITPLCEVITEQSAPTLPGVFFHSSPFDRVFVFDDTFLANTSAPLQPRYGAWKLTIAYSPQVYTSALTAGEQFQYEVITESRLKMRITFDKAAYGTGDRIGISASVTLDGAGIPNASVMLNIVAPGQSADDFLAFTSVSPDLLAKAQQTLSKEDVTAVGVKSFAIQLKGTVFNDFSNVQDILMSESGQPGIYTAFIDATTVPGTYEFYITAVGVTRDGVAYRREQRANQRVQVIPSPEFTLINVVYRAGEAAISVFPRDKFSHVLLFDPKFNPRITLTASGGGKFSDPLTFNGDGSYTGTLSYPATANPVIQVAIDGKVVVPDFPLQPITEMIWVDQVVDFHAGAQKGSGANTHENAAAVLGDPITKAPGLFVSLGGRGSITVGVKDHVVVNTGGFDVTIFVEPDVSLRAYSVKALDKDDNWVALGSSEGLTQSFSLGKLPAAHAIQVIDLSGQIVDNDGNKLSTPGVSIRAVGVKSVGTDSGGDGAADTCLVVRVLNPRQKPLGGKVDIEFQPQESGPVVKVAGADASGDIDVSGLQRTPQGLYQVTVTPTDVFTPSSQFVTIPASGFATAVFVINKS